MLIRGLIVDIDRNLSKIKEKNTPTIVRPLEGTRVDSVLHVVITFSTLDCNLKIIQNYNN